jgi:hypothetical protein
VYQPTAGCAVSSRQYPTHEFCGKQDWREALAGRPQAKPARRLFADALIRVKVALRHRVQKS